MAIRTKSGALLRCSPNPKVSVIIPVMNERKTISSVIYQAFRVHPETEVIVVANGSSDGTRRMAERAGAKVLWFEEPLGNDVGRSIGALAAKGDILLFTDGDIVIPASKLVPFVKAVQSGVDVALNQYLGPTNKQKTHSVVHAKHALNALLLRSDLLGTSMTTIPHAISRRMLEQVGSEALCVPPKAQALAILKGLNVRPVHYVEVGKSNPRRRRGFRKDPLENLIVGDHLEALSSYIRSTGQRGNHTDLDRMRGRVR